MAMGRRADGGQGEFWVRRESLRPAPSHPFYRQLNEILAAAEFDRFCEASCAQFYARKMGRPSVPPGVYFRMLMIGYFEKLDSEREIAWRCDDSRALRVFLGFGPDEATPDHSSLSRTRNRIDLETHQAVFDWVLKRLAERGLLKGQTLGIDASTLEADAALKSLVRRDTGKSYNEFVAGLAQASGVATPTAADLAKFDRKRKGKTLSNDDWYNPHDPQAKITKMKDGRTHLAYKNEHAVDLETGAIVAAEIHLANEGDTTTMWGTLEKAAASLQEVRKDPRVVEACKANGAVDANDAGDANKAGDAGDARDAGDAGQFRIRTTVQDKGYHSAQSLVNLEELDIRGYVAEPERGRQRWTIDDSARTSGDSRRMSDQQRMSEEQRAQEQADKRMQQKAVYRNRRRMRGRRGKSLHRRRGEVVERSFEHVLDDGGMRRVWLKDRIKIAKRYLIHTAAFNLGLVMRNLAGFGTPRGWADALRPFFPRLARAARHVTNRLTAVMRSFCDLSRAPITARAA